MEGLPLDEERLEVSASSPEYGEAKESIEVQYGQEALQIGFNAQYLLEFLRAVGPATSIRMQVKDAESAAEFRPCGDDGERYRYILMPLRF
jgi:DNA polymerase III subunit beta